MFGRRHFEAHQAHCTETARFLPLSLAVHNTPSCMALTFDLLAFCLCTWYRRFGNYIVNRCGLTLTSERERERESPPHGQYTKTLCFAGVRHLASVVTHCTWLKNSHFTRKTSREYRSIAAEKERISSGNYTRHTLWPNDAFVFLRCVLHHLPGLAFLGDDSTCSRWVTIFLLELDFGPCHCVKQTEWFG